MAFAYQDEELKKVEETDHCKVMERISEQIDDITISEESSTEVSIVEDYI